MFSNNTQYEPLGSLSGTTLPAGQRGKAAIKKGVKTLAFHVTVTGDLVIGTAEAAAIVDTGSILSIFDECGIKDGQDRLPSNPLDMRFLTEVQTAGTVGATRATSLNVGTYHLKERYSHFCSLPYSRNREEVAFLENNPDGDVFYYIKQTAAADGGGSRLATAGGGGGTVVVQNVVVTVRQEYIALGGSLPIFQPFWEPDVISVPGTNAAQQTQLMKDYYLDGLLFRQQISGGGPRVGDILNSLKLTATNRVLIGDEQVATDDVQADVSRLFGGAGYTHGGVNPYVYLPFRRMGQLSKVIRPNDANFKTTMSTQESATAGTSQIAVTYFGLIRDTRVRRTLGPVTKSAAEVAASGLKI